MCIRDRYPGVSVCAQLVGSRELFDFADGNQGLNMNSCQQVLNPGIIAQNRRMTAINNAVQVDLLGQANSEYLKGKQYAGMGGIADFSSGAALCPDGKSIVVVESVTKDVYKRQSETGAQSDNQEGGESLGLFCLL